MPETTIAPDFWTSETSVFFTSFWVWSPETWATVGWSNEKGLSRRNNLLKELSDPFIAVCYVTKSGGPNSIDPDLRGRLAGYYLVSHETGDRDQFTHPIHHDRFPEKWWHSVRALRAFSYLPEYPPNKRGAKEHAVRLVEKEDRADAAVRADYSEGKPLDKAVKATLDEIAARGQFDAARRAGAR